MDLLLNKKFKFTLVTMLVILIGCMSYLFFFRSHPAASALESGEIKAIPVAVYNATTRDIRNSFSLQTYLLPWKEIVLKPLPLSTIRKIHAKVGDVVKAGDILVSLDSESQSLKTELDLIENEMRNIDFSVTQALAKKSFLSKNEYKQKTLEHRATQLRVKLGKIENTNLMKSPISGRISEMSFKEGDYIDATNSTAVLKVIDDSKLRAQLYLPTEIATQINLKSLVLVTQPVLGENTKPVLVQAEIAALSPSIDLKTGTVFSEVYLQSVPENWRSGIFVEVQFVIAAREGVVSLPQEAIMYENSKPFIYVVKTSERGLASSSANNESQSIDFAKKVSLELGIRDKTYVEVTKGLEELDQVVVQGQGALSDGAKVEILQ